jgi:hypothetical protein
VRRESEYETQMGSFLQHLLRPIRFETFLEERIFLVKRKNRRKKIVERCLTNLSLWGLEQNLLGNTFFLSKQRLSIHASTKGRTLVKLFLLKIVCNHKVYVFTEMRKQLKTKKSETAPHPQL